MAQVGFIPVGKETPEKLFLKRMDDAEICVGWVFVTYKGFP